MFWRSSIYVFASVSSGSVRCKNNRWPSLLMKGVASSQTIFTATMAGLCNVCLPIFHTDTNLWADQPPRSHGKNDKATIRAMVRLTSWAFLSNSSICILSGKSTFKVVIQHHPAKPFPHASTALKLVDTINVLLSGRRANAVGHCVVERISRVICFLRCVSVYNCHVYVLV